MIEFGFQMKPLLLLHLQNLLRTHT